MYEPRYGIWIPTASNYGAMNHPESPRNASYSRAKALTQLAQECGFITTLIVQHTITRINMMKKRLFAKAKKPPRNQFLGGSSIFAIDLINSQYLLTISLNFLIFANRQLFFAMFQLFPK